jgi:cation transport ATPase
MAAAAEKAAAERRAEDASMQKALEKERRGKEIAQQRAETLKKREAEARRDGELHRGQSEDEKEKRRQAEQTAAAKVAEADEAKEKAATYGNIAAAAVGVLLAILFEVVLHLTGWGWLLNHPNSYGLQAGTALLLFLMGWPIVRPHGWKSNKLFWVGAVLAILIGVISLLGGFVANRGG